MNAGGRRGKLCSIPFDLFELEARRFFSKPLARVRVHWHQRQRLRAARCHTVDRDAHLAGFVSQVVLDTSAREDHDPDRHAIKHLIVSLEGCGLGVFGPVRLEGDLRHFAVARPSGRDALGALR